MVLARKRNSQINLPPSEGGVPLRRGGSLFPVHLRLDITKEIAFAFRVRLSYKPLAPDEYVNGRTSNKTTNAAKPLLSYGIGPRARGRRCRILEDVHPSLFPGYVHRAARDLRAWCVLVWVDLVPRFAVRLDPGEKSKPASKDRMDRGGVDAGCGGLDNGSRRLCSEKRCRFSRSRSGLQLLADIHDNPHHLLDPGDGGNHISPPARDPQASYAARHDLHHLGRVRALSTLLSAVRAIDARLPGDHSGKHGLPSNVLGEIHERRRPSDLFPSRFAARRRSRCRDLLL